MKGRINLPKLLRSKALEYNATSDIGERCVKCLSPKDLLKMNSIKNVIYVLFLFNLLFSVTSFKNPIFVQDSIAGLKLNDPTSVTNIIGTNYKIQTEEDEFNHINIINLYSNQLLILYLHPGDVYHSYNEFLVLIPQKPFNFTPTKTLSVKEFKTDNGIRIGLDFNTATNIMGTNFIKMNHEDKYTIKYEVADLNIPPKTYPILFEHNLPAYYFEITFFKNKIIKFQFGFYYP